jgi:hypothetical protein
LTFIAAVDFHDDTLVDRLTLPSKTRWKLEVEPVLSLQGKKLLGNRLELLDGSGTCLNVEIVIVTFLFDAVEPFFELVLAMRNKAGIFGSPCRMRSPLIIQNRPAELVAPTAHALALPLGQKPVAGSKTAAV